MVKFVVAGVAIGIAFVLVCGISGSTRNGRVASSVPSHFTSASRMQTSSLPTDSVVRVARRPSMAGPHAASKMTIPFEFQPSPLQPNEVRLTSVPADPAVIEGSISKYEMATDYIKLAGWIQRGVTPSVRRALETCAKALRGRGAVIDKQYEWSVGLHIIGDRSSARVVEVIAARDHWPDVFDDDAKHCWVDALSAINFTSDKLADVTVEFPLCVYPSSL